MTRRSGVHGHKFARSAAVRDADDEEGRAGKIALEQLYGAFIIFMAGCALAAMVFGIEVRIFIILLLMLKLCCVWFSSC